MGLKVIGAGFGRTGTLSLKHALETLGFVKCHHMESVALSDPQIAAWHGIARGETPDWDRIFEGFQASCDWPSCDHFEALMNHYPEAKVVLSVRDADRWYDSAAETIYAVSKEFPRALGWIVPKLGRFNRFVFAAIWDGTFQGRFEERDFAIRTYREHIERVKERVPPERLLVFEAREGWEPLCQFLGAPVPEGPYPHLNDAETIKRGLRVLRVAKWAIPALLLGALYWLVP
ncbi:sulfotransferase family protein [Myxococcota bacterium]|nr:sulfotransferase family protein [Myxococcota bacterium]